MPAASASASTTAKAAAARRGAVRSIVIVMPDTRAMTFEEQFEVDVGGVAETLHVGGPTTEEALNEQCGVRVRMLMLVRACLCSCNNNSIFQESKISPRSSDHKSLLLSSIRDRPAS